ncbi:hypothetical protein BSR29_05605 [Boudabousia liubingyangii]|uniref:2-succinyl-5-enolpyruvyl-6-hydroxy-3-cyclohexene-1-carboxylate synthase n=1 Tax=Boudabousia liubingyangii TaxID=1921764 RepID=A0A1Q5PLM0_9ACTO|nr:thiamine pyrophosphate-binding protein [Boudabousia liubingyangii]OKL47955.1 hypothetical protein BSR29_05605 [Boudabousia liubingyangii]
MSEAQPWSQQPPSIQVAHALITSLLSSGVRDLVLAPGSRNAPISYVAAAAEAAGFLRVHPCADERSAGFYALGLARASQAFGVREEDQEDFLASSATLDAPPSSRAAQEVPTAGPVAIAVTSGTAVANLHPAVLEAAESATPLLVLSADRPHHLRGTGANQTTQQVGIFGAAPVWDFDVPASYPPAQVPSLVRRACSAALGLLSNQPGPAHLNLCFDVPLTPQFPMPVFEAAPLRPLPGQWAERRPHSLSTPTFDPGFPVDFKQVQTLVVAGDSAGPEAAHFAAQNHWPLLAEPSSRARNWNLEGAFGNTLCAPVDYQRALGLREASELAKQVKQVVVFGHPTLSRPVTRLLSSAAKVVVAADYATWPDAAAAGSEVVTATDLLDQSRAFQAEGAGLKAAEALFNEASNPGDASASSAEAGEWCQAWLTAATPELGEDPREELCARIWQQAAKDGSILVVGASTLIRVFDRVAGALPETEGELPPVVFANRGLAGIDGTIATAKGIAAHTGQPVRVILGDLTFLHDAMSLIPTLGGGQGESSLQLVLVDDEGGAIFAGLEHAQAPKELFERCFRVGQKFDYQSFAKAVGARYLAPEKDDYGWLKEANKSGVEIVHIRVPFPCD